MAAAEPLTITQADDALWHRYDALARRAYGHTVPDIAHLGPHGDRRVALRAGNVVAGGLGLAVPQFFGGRPVPAASLACACVAPEERGDRLTVRMIAERLRPLREQGAVLATLWTTSNGYARRLGWEAPAQTFSWTVPAAALKQCFTGSGHDIAPDTTDRADALREDLAARWNGTWQRPAWWRDWQQRRHPDTTSYRFAEPGGPPTGVLTIAVEHPAQGRQVVVHDFWAADRQVAAAMLAFLGRHDSRIPTVAFQRTGLPPSPLLLHHLHRAGSVTARAWHPWMLRVLDPRRAVQLRGWPDTVDLTLPIEITGADGTAGERFVLRIRNGVADLEPTQRTGRVTLTRGQFAVWYAGGYRSAAAASLAGVQGPTQALTPLLQATADREPWLADYF